MSGEREYIISEVMIKLLTLVIVEQEGRVLLGMKKRGFGAGRWNGFGGKVEPGETIEAAARRELREEAGIEAGELALMGVHHFTFARNPEEFLEVHVFRCRAFTGEMMETEEMRPQWYRIADIPFDDMWPDDRHWLPLLLAGKKFHTRFCFGQGDEILEQEITEVETI